MSLDNLLALGEKAVDFFKELCRHICMDVDNATNSHGLHSSMSADIYNDIKNFKCSQLDNGEAIQTLSDSICPLSSFYPNFKILSMQERKRSLIS